MINWRILVGCTAEMLHKYIDGWQYDGMKASMRSEELLLPYTCSLHLLHSEDVDDTEAAAVGP